MTGARKRAFPSLASDLSLYTVCTVLAQIVTAVTAIGTRRILGPEAFGLWVLVQTGLMYLEYSHLGTLMAVGRDIPFYRGKGDTAKVDRIKNTVFCFSLASAGVAAGLTALGAWILRDAMEPRTFMAVFLAAGLTVLQRANSLLLTLARADKQFVLAGQLAIVSALVNAVLVIGLSWAYGLNGFLAAMALSFVFNTVFLVSRHAFGLRWEFDGSEWRSLVTYGAPLMALALLGTFVETSSRLAVAHFLGVGTLGVYSVALLIFGYLYAVPNAVSIVMVPNLHETFGRREDVKDLREYVADATAAFSNVMPYLIAGAWFGGPWLVETLLGRYEAGIPALRYLALGIFFLAPAQACAQTIYAIRRHFALFPIYGSACLVMWGLNAAAAKGSGSLAGIALSTTAGFAVYWLMLHAYASGKAMEAGEAYRTGGMLLAKFAAMVGLLLVLERCVPLPEGLARCAVQFAGFAVVWTPLVWRQSKALWLKEKSS